MIVVQKHFEKCVFPEINMETNVIYIVKSFKKHTTSLIHHLNEVTTSNTHHNTTDQRNTLNTTAHPILFKYTTSF